MVFSKAAYNIWLEPLLSTIDMALKKCFVKSLTCELQLVNAFFVAISKMT